MSTIEIEVGDWVVAGTTEDTLDLGQIVSIVGDQAEVAWESWARTSCDLSDKDVEVYGSKPAAEARYKERIRQAIEAVS